MEAFAERRVLVIGGADEIDYSAGLYRLRRCGYRPIESFPVLESDFETASGMSERLRDMLSEAIRTAQSGRVEEILLAIPWNQRRLINSIVAVLRVVPIPIRLAPDRSIEGLLHKPRKEIGSTWVVDLHRGPLTLSECAIKRTFDIVLSSVALITLAPTMSDSRDSDQARFARTCVLFAASQWLQQQGIPDPQVPNHDGYGAGVRGEAGNAQ